MKLADVAFLLFLICGAPALAVCLMVASDSVRRKLLAIMFFFTCHVKKPFYQEIFFHAYRGTARGYIVCFANVMIFGFFIYLLSRIGKRKFTWWPCNMLPLFLYMLVAVLSCFDYCPEPKYSLYELWKFFCSVVFYWTAVNLVQNKKDVYAVLGGCFTAMAYQTAVVIVAKYVLHQHVVRVIGTFPHPNSLAMYINMINPIAICMLMGGFAQHPLFTAGASAGGVLCVLFTKSRGALVMMLAALSGCVGISFLRRPTIRKFGVIVAIFFFGSIIGALAAPRLIRRFQKAPEESEMTRIYFNHAAKAMMHDHFLGIGLNNYPYVLEHTKYYWYVYPDHVNDRDPDAFRESVRGRSRLGNCHHIYYLTGAEMGYPGLILLIWIILRFYWKAVRIAFRLKEDLYSAIGVGLVMGFFTLHVQGLLEWILRQTQVQFLFFGLSGFTVAVHRLALAERKALRQQQKA